ncbi:MAG: Crp/Fnr family transcriptional regulator [candidate division NC10 bacterium]|nr:Crp/Fnr family transcriptional regulator [candidate division NC10 bacterium]MBI2114727.1 Crp/Fnr family transcriptional regulator [candidate division NC10 bacterium]MBI2457201.1 Crp/Fnr family transcriptional regulator [candidate division NC10 bacterium]
MGIALREEVPPRNGNGKTFQDPKVRFPVHTSTGKASGEPGGIPSTRPDTHDPKITFLRSVPLFADLASVELHRIADRTAWRDYRRRQAIYFPGDPADALYVVRQGRVKISRLSEDGKEATLNLVGPGEPFGEECVLDAPARETIAEVLEPVQVLRIPREELASALHAQPAFALAVARLMGGRRHAAEVRLEEMVFKTVRSRLAALLARLARNHGRRTAGGILLDLSLAHQDLAGHIGSTRETTTLTLNQFKRGGLLRIDHCRILIRDLAGLEAIA